MEQQLAPGIFFGERHNCRHLPGLSITESVYAAHAVLPRHAHTHAFLSFIRHGTYRETYRTMARDYAAPTVVFHPPGESHADHFAQTGGRILSVEFAPCWLEQVRAHAPILDGSAEFEGGLPCWLMLRVCRELRNWDEVSPLAVEGVVLEILAMATRHTVKKHGRVVPHWLRQVRDLLHERFADHLTSEQIAQTAGVHPTHLMRAFRQVHGCTLGEYVRRLRTDFACRRLAASDVPLVDIALSAGFCDQGHFTKAFKRATGLTPSEYRKAARAR
jgi:AraC family transcriptional regulator